jgi:hypothetical protein
MGDAGCVALAAPRLYASRFPHLASRASYDPIHQRTKEHDDTDDSVGREERRIES